MESTNEIEFLRILFAGTGIMAALALSVVMFVIFYQRKLYQNRLRASLQEQKHNQELIINNLKSQEKERERIARELHDDIGGLLATMRLYANEASKDKLHAIIDQARDGVSRISLNLMPATLQEFGLESALNELADRIRESSGMAVNMQIEISEPLPSEKELHLFRIVQELANNSIKYSQGTQLNLSLISKPEQFEFAYSDNGVGFDPDHMETKGSGLGLRNLVSRARILVLDMQLNAAKGKGVEVTLKPKYPKELYEG